MVSSLYALNRGLMFKWIWRFLLQDQSLWVRVIKAIHGENGKLDAVNISGPKSCWLDIVSEVNLLAKKGIILRDFMCFKLGNGEKTRFWEDAWNGGDTFRNQFPRLYALESNKCINVAEKMLQPGLAFSFRRNPRGGVEQHQMDNLVARMLCNALKSKHEENEAIFMRLRLLARHVMTSKLKINTYCSKQLRETIITLSVSSGNSQLMDWGRISTKLFSKSSGINPNNNLQIPLMIRQIPYMVTSPNPMNKDNFTNRRCDRCGDNDSNEQLVKLYKESHLAKCLIAYNERKSNYIVVPLPSVSQDFKITLLDDDDGLGSGRFSYLLV
nr:RNA-directed DNA polymerase, eukaryota, reverse transcriptase zinc-binding domain protein [Tanacetum cinerariifolium]